MLLSAVSVLVVAQPSSKFTEGFVNYPVLFSLIILTHSFTQSLIHTHSHTHTHTHTHTHI